MKRPIRLSPQKVAALQALSIKFFGPKPEGVRLTTLEALWRDGFVHLRRSRAAGWSNHGARWRLSQRGLRALLAWTARMAS